MTSESFCLSPFATGRQRLSIKPLCRSPIEMSPTSPIEMSLEASVIEARGVAYDDGDPDEPAGTWQAARCR